MCQKACYLQSNRSLPSGIIGAGRVLKPAPRLSGKEAVKKQRSVAAPAPVPEKKKTGIIEAGRILKPAPVLPKKETVEKHRPVLAPAPVPEKKKRWQDTLIKEMGLSDRTKAALIKNGITRAGKVENMGDEELLGMRGIAKKSLDQIRKAIKKLRK